MARPRTKKATPSTDIRTALSNGSHIDGLEGLVRPREESRDGTHSAPEPKPELTSRLLSVADSSSLWGFVEDILRSEILALSTSGGRLDFEEWKRLELVTKILKTVPVRNEVAYHAESTSDSELEAIVSGHED